MAMNQSSMKTYVTGGILVLFALIIFAQLLPYAWKYMTEGPDNVNYTLSDVPGGGLITGLGIFLVVMALVIGLVIKALDF